MAKMRVIGGTLNVRCKPEITARVISVLTDGSEIETAPCETEGWAEYPEAGGYVMAKWLEAVPEPKKPAPKKKK